MSKWDIDVFKCPVCREGLLSLSGNSLLCGAGHCFDIAAKGYVNFVPNQKKTRYDKALFENRRAVFEAGFFSKAADNLINAINGAYSVLDAGCGEGYYAKRLSSNSDIFALDIEKEAVRIAANKGDAIKWMVADIANIPLVSHSVDAVLNVFTPANFAEFRRVLKKDGLLVKALPGDRHLQEMRVLAKKSAHDSNIVVEHFKKFFRLIEKVSYQETFSVMEEEFNRFLRMTPLMFNAELDTYSDKITIDMEILVGRI